MVNTSPLDVQQQQIDALEESTERGSETMDRLTIQRQYVFREPSVEECLKEAAGRSLSEYFIGPEFTTPDDMDARTALCERY